VESSVRAARKNGPLGDFLRARRALVDPTDVGIGGTRRRRVIGLRRDELAQLANISVHYYTRLEQGKHAAASRSVLDSLATALLLPPAERAYLHRLAGVERVDRLAREVQARPETIRLLDALGTTPAFVLGPNMDILATNAAAESWQPDDHGGRVNAIRWLLGARAAVRLFGEDRTGIATELIGMLRLHAGRKPTHPGIQRVVGELSSSSAFFRRVWAENAVSIGGQQRGHLREAGAAELVAETLAVQLAEDQTVLVFIPRSQSLSAVQFPPTTD
jgi:transcriptional regulator with XRE-family HTH domain